MGSKFDKIIQSSGINESTARAAREQTINCPYCKRDQVVRGGQRIRAMMVNRDTYCHEVIDLNGKMIFKAPMIQR